MIKIYYFIIYLGIRLVWLIVNLIPARKAFGFGASGGKLLFPLMGTRKKISVDNIIKAGITDSPTAAKKLAKESVAHFMGHIMEGVKVPAFMTPEHMKSNISIEIPDETKELLDKRDQPVLIITPHLGCWEVGLCLVSSLKPTLVIASTFNNPWVQRFSESHFRGGVEVYPNKFRFSPVLMRRWAEGCAFVLAVDQHAGRHGIWVDFFGRPACTHTSPARLHLSTGFPVIIGAFLRTGTLKYKAVASKPLIYQPTGNREADTIAITTEMNRQFEELIRMAPEQYLWAHRRWRDKPAVVKRRY